MNGLALCSGIGSLELGVEIAIPSYRTVCYVEREAYAAATLVARMEDGALAEAPIWDDIYSFDGRRWRGRVHCLTAGFPCQPWSAAGKGGGTDDERWIWPRIAEIIGEVFGVPGDSDLRAGVVFLENVPPLVVRGGLALVLADLARLGFDAEWGMFRASDVEAPQGRQRVYILAYRDGIGLEGWRPELRDEGRVSDSFWDNSKRTSDLDVAHAGCTERRGRKEPTSQPRSGSSANDCGAGGALGESERAQRRSDDQQFELFTGGREEANRSRGSGGDVADARDGLVSEPRRRPEGGAGSRSASPLFRLFPPGPAAADLWREIIAERPDLAPALISILADAEDGGQGLDANDCGQPEKGRDDETGQDAEHVEGETEPAIRRVVDGMAYRVDRLRACGNGVVPLAAAIAFRVLADRAFAQLE